MITKERLAELRKDIDGPAWVDEAELCQGLKEALDTIETLLRENERLVGLSGKTNYCLQCESYARENEELARKWANRKKVTDIIADHRDELQLTVKRLKRVVEAAEAFITHPIGRRQKELDESLKALRGSK